MRFWVATAFMEPRSLVPLARLLDEYGFHGLMVSDHVVYPRELTSRYPYSPHPDGRPIWDPETPWPDPWVTIGAMSAVTERLHFATNIYVAPNRPLLQVAKEVGTAAVLSGDRVVLGVGAGWMREEFDLQGQDFDNRGRRLTEMVGALRTLWGGGWVEHRGEFYDVPELTMEPHPSRPVPIWGGGHTKAALRRCAAVCDGWIGNAYRWDEAEAHVTTLRGLLDEQGRAGDPFSVVCGLYELPTVELFQRAEAELGITDTLCLPWVLDGNLTDDERNGRTLDVEVYRPSVERFANEILSVCQPG
jgi:probable F420-dependent oxidoreductase